MSSKAPLPSLPTPASVLRGATTGLDLRALLPGLEAGLAWCGEGSGDEPPYFLASELRDTKTRSQVWSSAPGTGAGGGLQPTSCLTPALELSGAEQPDIWPRSLPRRGPEAAGSRGAAPLCGPSHLGCSARSCRIGPLSTRCPQGPVSGNERPVEGGTCRTDPMLTVSLFSLLALSPKVSIWRHIAMVLGFLFLILLGVLIFTAYWGE